MSKICILIHGYLTDYRDFTVLPSRIMNNYDQVILLNLPGHQEGNLKNFTKTQVFNYLDIEMNKIYKDKDGYINSIDVIGFSLGGALTWYLAHHYQFHRIVLLSPSIYYINFNLLLDKQKYISSLNSLPKEEKELAKSKYKKRNKEALKFVKENTMKKITLANGLEFVKIVKHIKKDTTNINIPMLIVRGNLDELVSKKSIDICLKHNDNIHKSIYIIEDIGHMMLRTDRADEIICKIKEFLEDVTYE